ncbi:hypothetical protein CCR81_01435 [Halorhodospira halophila]|nr:hypothetical protein [Halorhodospira halophila]
MHPDLFDQQRRAEIAEREQLANRDARITELKEERDQQTSLRGPFEHKTECAAGPAPPLPG